MQLAEVERIVAAFTDATNRHDVDEMLTLVSDDVVFEGTTPPDGARIEGDKASLRALWEGIFRDSPNGRRRTGQQAEAQSKWPGNENAASCHP